MQSVKMTTRHGHATTRGNYGWGTNIPTTRGVTRYPGLPKKKRIKIEIEIEIEETEPARPWPNPRPKPPKYPHPWGYPRKVFL